MAVKFIPQQLKISPDPTAIAREWTALLTDRELSHAANDFQSGQGASSYVAHHIKLSLFEGTYTLNETTQSRISYAGMTLSQPSCDRTKGRWTIVVTGASQVRLQLAPGVGKTLLYLLEEDSPDSVLLNGKPWRMRGI